MNIVNKRRLVFIGVIFVMAAVLIFLLSGCDNDIWNTLESEYLQSEISDTLQNESTVQSKPQSEKSTQSASSSASVPEENESQSEESSSSAPEESVSQPEESVPESAELRFRSQKLLKQHYEKHGIEMGFDSAEEYEKAAAAVVSHPDVLHKIEAEDGDDVYYIESTNEFVVVSTDGYLRTYFNPDRGIDYFNKQ